MNMPSPRTADAAGPSAFELDAVHFEANGRSILQPLSLRLGAGQVVGLVGQNGSGKSTLVKMLAR